MVTDRVDRDMLAGSKVRILANMAVGYDNVDPAMAGAEGVWLTNTPGVLAETTADLAFALLMAGARLVALGDRDARAGRWQTWSPTGYLGTDREAPWPELHSAWHCPPMTASLIAERLAVRSVGTRIPAPG